MILHVGLVTMIHHPPGQEIIIVGIELILSEPPLLIGEAVGEVDVLQDTSAIGTGTPGQAGHTAIHMGGCSTVEIAAFEIQSPQEAVDSLGEGGILSPSQSLAGDDTSVLFVFKWCQHPFQGLNWPGHVIVSKDDDLGGDLGNGPGHLTSLVCLLDRHAANPMVLCGGHFGHGPLCFVQVPVDGDQDDFFWLVLENGGNGAFEFLSLTIQGG